MAANLNILLLSCPAGSAVYTFSLWRAAIDYRPSEDFLLDRAHIDCFIAHLCLFVRFVYKQQSSGPSVSIQVLLVSAGSKL